MVSYFGKRDRLVRNRAFAYHRGKRRDFMRRHEVWAAIGILAGVAGCGTIRYVHKTQSGGTIALAGDPQKAMEQARQAMADHCQGQYTVVEEGETVVGQTTTTGAAETTREHRDNRGETTSAQQTTTTRQETEYRITYVCGMAPPPGTPPTPPG